MGDTIPRSAIWCSTKGVTPSAEDQRRIAIVLLRALVAEHFALAGAGAIREHGITSRPTRDVDLFALPTLPPDQFVRAVTKAEAALQAAGWKVTRTRAAPLFARLEIEGSADEAIEVDLGVDWRSETPIELGVGPVLALPDAVGNKVAAAFSRAEVRDLLDLDSIRQSGLYPDDALLALAEERDAGFNRAVFAQNLLDANDLSVRDTISYGVDEKALGAIKERLVRWGRKLAPEAGT
jgi:hypothetical protein